MEEINITPIINAIIAVISVVITCYVIPLLKKKMNAAKYAEMVQFIEIAVKAAEQLFKTEECTEKKTYVVDYLSERGYVVDDSIDAAIEAMVLDVHNALNG